MIIQNNLDWNNHQWYSFDWIIHHILGNGTAILFCALVKSKTENRTLHTMLSTIVESPDNVTIW